MNDSSIDNVTFACRPPVAYIVEGHGEYLSYPTLFSKITNVSKGIKVPILNSGGNGNLIKHFDEQMSDLLSVEKPVNVIITIDLIDVISRNLYSNCIDLKKDIQNKLNNWINLNNTNLKYQPFPLNFSIVIQVQKFETWLIADKNSLHNNQYITLPANDYDWQNVDQEIPNPVSWLEPIKNMSFNIKKPKTCKEICGCLDVQVMGAKSPSFNKFSRETLEKYRIWEQLSGYGDF